MGVFLLVLPLLWSHGAADGAGQDWTYIFGIWAVLIALAAVSYTHLDVYKRQALN